MNNIQRRDSSVVEMGEFFYAKDKKNISFGYFLSELGIKRVMGEFFQVMEKIGLDSVKVVEQVILL